MTTYYGEIMTKVLGLDEDNPKVPSADFGGKLRVINERISLADGFVVGDFIVFAKLPKGARLIDIRMQTQIDMVANVLFNIGTGAGDPEKYALELDFTVTGRFAPEMVSVAKVASLGVPVEKTETLSLQVIGEDVAATDDYYIHFLTLYTLD